MAAEVAWRGDRTIRRSPLVCSRQGCNADPVTRLIETNDAGRVTAILPLCRDHSPAPEDRTPFTGVSRHGGTFHEHFEDITEVPA